MAAIQGDTLSLMAHDLLPLMLITLPSDPRAQAAMDQLRAWDGRMGRDRVEPLIFTAWLRELNRTLFAAKLGPYFADYWSLRPDAVRAVLTSHPDWCGASGCGSASRDIARPRARRSRVALRFRSRCVELGQGASRHIRASAYGRSCRG